MRKVLFVMSDNHYRLYNEGINYYALKKDIIIDIFRVDIPRNLILLNKLCYKYNFCNYKDKYYSDLRKEFLQKIKDYDQIVFMNLFFDEHCFIDKDLALKLSKVNCSLFWVDTIRSLEFSNHGFDLWFAFKNIYSFEFNDIDYAKQKFYIKVKYVPMGTSYCAFDIGDEVTKKYDVTFVGIQTPKRLEYLDQIAEYCLKKNINFFVAGHFWHNSNAISEFLSKRKFVKKHPVLAKYVKNTFIEPKDLAIIYRSSKIVLNINVAYHKGANQRIFDVLLCKSLLITDLLDTEQIELINNEDFVMCGSIDDMIDKIDYYLCEEDKRRNIVLSSNKKVAKQYTIMNTLDAILKIGE